MRKTPYQTIDKPTDVAYELIDSKKNELVQHKNNLLPHYLKEHALRKLTQFYFYSGLKVVHDNSGKNHQQTHDVNCST